VQFVQFATVLVFGSQHRLVTNQNFLEDLIPKAATFRVRLYTS